MKVFLLILLAALTSCTTQKNSVARSLQKDSILADMQKVANWQIQHFTYSTDKNLHDYGIDSWTNGTLYLGVLELAGNFPRNSVYSQWLTDIGNKAGWEIAANFRNNKHYSLYHADELCMGQFYLNMYDREKKDYMYKSTKERVDWIMNNPPNKQLRPGNKQVWSWCDALFMAPPVYIHVGNIEQDDKYIRYMDEEFKRTYDYLYDKQAKIFFRDGSYFDKREENGEKVFWGRGNGWVAAGLVNILKLLPAASPYRPFYEDLFKEMMPRLASFQNASGFWHASLLDPASYPSPEVSATALIAYAMAYGINSNLLSKNDYLPKVISAWNALTSAINEEGKLGWVQPIGADPKKVTEEMTAVYGVGAFLMAGNEIHNLSM